MKLRKGSTRIVLLVDRFALKFPKPTKWKTFLRGILANLDEVMWYRSSPPEWQQNMAPVISCFFGGLLLISARAEEVTEGEYQQIDLTAFDPLPMDSKRINFGRLKGRTVLVDYADSRYFCSDCENIFKRKRLCHSEHLD